MVKCTKQTCIVLQDHWNIGGAKCIAKWYCTCEWGQRWGLHRVHHWGFSEQVKQTSFRNSTNKANPSLRHRAALKALDSPFLGVCRIYFSCPERCCSVCSAAEKESSLLPYRGWMLAAPAESFLSFPPLCSSLGNGRMGTEHSVFSLADSLL